MVQQRQWRVSKTSCVWRQCQTEQDWQHSPTKTQLEQRHGCTAWRRAGAASHRELTLCEQETQLTERQVKTSTRATFETIPGWIKLGTLASFCEGIPKKIPLTLTRSFYPHGTSTQSDARRRLKQHFFPTLTPAWEGQNCAGGKHSRAICMQAGTTQSDWCTFSRRNPDLKEAMHSPLPYQNYKPNLGFWSFRITYEALSSKVWTIKRSSQQSNGGGRNSGKDREAAEHYLRQKSLTQSFLWSEEEELFLISGSK